jgi:glycolate oxidase FAD binding subunit
MAGALDRLRAVCGDEHARLAAGNEGVPGAPARWVVRPGSTSEVSGVLQVAAELNLHVVVRGAGTKLGWGGVPEAAEILLDLSRLAGVVEHSAGDRVVVVRAGTRLSDLNDELAKADQRLPLDEMVPGATVGGAVATGTAGPLRLRFGPPRDQLIGVTVVRADGVVAHSGGKVVKNVAGYDLGRLVSGSYGTLAVLTQAAFKLAPRPEARAFVYRPVRSPSEVSDLCRRIKESQLGPAAVEVECPIMPQPKVGSNGARLTAVPDRDCMVVLLEGPADGVAARVERLGPLLGGDTRATEEPPSWWGTMPFGPDDVAIQVTTPIGQLFAPVYSLRDAAKGVRVRTFCSPASGTLYAGIAGDTPPDRVAGIVDSVRAVATLHGGSCVVLSAPARIRGDLDMWGPVEGVALMRALKHEFDPDRRLAPGRFVDGI